MTTVGAQRERLILLHIPKTAGTSVSVFLTTQFPAEQLFHVRAPSRGPAWGGAQGPVTLLKAMPPDWQQRIRCVVGHFRFSEELHRSLPGPSRYVTVLRDPIERALSQHGQYNRRRQLEGKPQLSFREFVGNADAFVSNQQTRMLSSGAFETQAADASLASAKDNLRRCFELVGTTERIDDFMRLLCERFSFSQPHTPRENVNSNRLRREDISEDLLRALLAATELDRELHAFAGTLLDDAFASSGLRAGRDWPLQLQRRFDVVRRGARRVRRLFTTERLRQG